MDFKFLFIYNHNGRKEIASGWKIFDSMDEIQELQKYYHQQKPISLYVNNFLTIRYETYDDLMKDCEIVTISDEMASAIESAFDTNVFGIFPL